MIGIEPGVQHPQYFQKTVGVVGVPPARTETDLAKQVDLLGGPFGLLDHGRVETEVIPAIFQNSIPDRLDQARRPQGASATAS